MVYSIKKYKFLLSQPTIALTTSLLLILCFFRPMYCQVYNYSPISYRDIETNPAIIASESKNLQIDVSHQNTFSSTNPFSCSTLNLSKYFESTFSGLGLVLNNTNMGDSINYNYIGLSAGYRNILFNKVHIRIGVTYKLINTNAPSGNFDYYSFAASGSSKQKNINDNLNLSLSISSPSDRYFVSFASLDINFPWNNTNNSSGFPTYYVFHLGNLMSLFDGSRRDSEISYTAFSSYSLITKKNKISQSIDLKFIMNITRNISIKYGSRVGYVENKYVHLTPFLTFFKRKSALTIAYDFYTEKNNFLSTYPSSIQLGFIYNL